MKEKMEMTLNERWNTNFRFFAHKQIVYFFYLYIIILLHFLYKFGSKFLIKITFEKLPNNF